MTLLQGENGDIDFHSIIPCSCYTCNPDKVKIPKKCQKDMHFSCKECDKAFKDAGVDREEWYGTHKNIWDTKWNACDVSLSGVTESKWKGKYKFTINYNFWTAWSPPEKVYNALAQILEDKYGRKVFIEVTCYDEFVWKPDDESDEDTGYHIDPEQLYYWNSSPHFREKGFLNPHPYQEEYTIKTHKENHQIFNMDDVMKNGERLSLRDIADKTLDDDDEEDDKND